MAGYKWDIVYINSQPNVFRRISCWMKIWCSLYFAENLPIFCRAHFLAKKHLSRHSSLFPALLQTIKHFIIFKDIASEIECSIFAQNCEYRSFSNANTKEVRDNFIYQVINENGANCTFKNYLRHCGICFLSIIRIYCVIKGISQHDWQCLLQRKSIDFLLKLCRWKSC